MVGAAPRLATAATEELLPEPTVNDSGLHTQPWFYESFLDLGEDLNEAAANGKDLAVFFEQRGCPYCREMHTVNLRNPEIVDYIKANYLVIQLNLWGSREVTDFDGEVMEERALARKWLVNFTPTISFFSREVAGSSGKSGRDLEAARMPGYFKPYHFASMFEFVHDGSYKTENFQKYIQEKFRRLEEEGKKPSIW
ncbi:MAG: thioredoxin family protein [Hyphomicrobiales bacterium]|nr:thioredoxin family protein [Hyphomicrobiales bacterium]